MRRVPALRGAEDVVAGMESRGRRGGREDDAGEFGAGYPGQGGLVLVLAADLEEVEEIRGAGVDGDEVLGGGGGGGGEGGDGEVGGALWGGKCGVQYGRGRLGGGEGRGSGGERGLGAWMEDGCGRRSWRGLHLRIP